MGATNVPTAVVRRKRLDQEFAVRNLTGRRVAELIGVHEMTISRARSGQPIEVSIINRLAEVLAAIPPGLHPLALQLIAMPGELEFENANAAGAQSAAIEEVRNGAGTTAATPRPV